MGWATNHVIKLDKGQTVSFRPKGNSMQPKINSGDLVTVSPDMSSLNVGDIVLCKVKGSYYVHLISAVRDGQFQISNNHGHVNGWITTNSIFGKVIDISA